MQSILLLCLAATTVMAGFHGTFNSASCYSAPSSASFDTITSALTIEAWVYPLTGGTFYQGIGGTWNDVTAGQRSWFMWLEGRKPAAYTTSSPGSFAKISAPSTIPENQWSHVAFTKSSTGVAKLFVDGVNVATGTLPLSIYVNDELMRVGCAYAGASSVKYLNGHLDSVRVWNVDRDATEIQAGMCGTPSGTGLVAQYLFDEGAGTTLGDTSGNANNAVVSHGAPGWGTGNGQGTCGTHDPAVAAFCDDVAAKCTALDAECTTIRNGGNTAVADDCDTSVAACNDVHQDCVAKAATCPLA